MKICTCAQTKVKSLLAEAAIPLIFHVRGAQKGATDWGGEGRWWRGVGVHGGGLGARGEGVMMTPARW